MRKRDIISRIYKAADLYKQHLLNNNLLLLYQESPKKVGIIETAFMSYNFLHLTGVDFPDSADLEANEFFERAINRKLSEHHITLKKDGTTEMKLEVISDMIVPDLSARIFGTFTGDRINLTTDRLAGGVRCSMGFVRDDDYFYPNTILKGDIRDNIDRSHRVLAVFRKKISDSVYSERTYLAKKVDLSKLNLPKKFEYLKDVTPIV